MQALYAYEQGGGPADEILSNVLRPSLETDAAGERFAYAGPHLLQAELKGHGGEV